MEFAGLVTRRLLRRIGRRRLQGSGNGHCGFSLEIWRRRLPDARARGDGHCWLRRASKEQHLDRPEVNGFAVPESFFLDGDPVHKGAVGRSNIPQDNRAVAHNNLAWLYATCDDQKYRDPKAALDHALTAVKLTNWKVSEFIDTLAEANYANGEYQQAVEIQKKALALEPQNTELQEHMERYRKAAGALRT